jgi:hypothetical protein
MSQSTPLSVLNLTVHAEHCLKRGRVYDVETLKAMEARDILSIPDIGKKTLQEINLALTEYENTTKPEKIEMNETKHGGPAFPTTQYVGGISPTGHSGGMTLRDYFAAKYMQSLFSKDGIGIQDIETIAMYSYKVADVMLKAREK